MRPAFPVKLVFLVGMLLDKIFAFSFSILYFSAANLSSYDCDGPTCVMARAAFAMLAFRSLECCFSSGSLIFYWVVDVELDVLLGACLTLLSCARWCGIGGT